MHVHHALIYLQNFNTWNLHFAKKKTEILTHTKYLILIFSIKYIIVYTLPLRNYAI